MKLGNYSTRVSPYLDASDRYPFRKWSEGEPTKSIAWYHAYNLTKHDREALFAEASLEHAMDAVAACAIIVFAQYGTLPTFEIFNRRVCKNWIKS